MPELPTDPLPARDRDFPSRRVLWTGAAQGQDAASTGDEQGVRDVPFLQVFGHAIQRKAFTDGSQI